MAYSEKKYREKAFLFKISIGGFEDSEVLARECNLFWSTAKKIMFRYSHEIEQRGFAEHPRIQLPAGCTGVQIEVLPWAEKETQAEFSHMTLEAKGAWRGSNRVTILGGSINA